MKTADSPPLLHSSAGPQFAGMADVVVSNHDKET